MCRCFLSFLLFLSLFHLLRLRCVLAFVFYCEVFGDVCSREVWLYCTVNKLHFLTYFGIMQRCTSSFPSVVVALNQFSSWSLDGEAVFPPESSIAELQPRCTVTDSTSVWGVFTCRFPAGRKKKKLSHFISSIKNVKNSANFMSL